MNVGGGVPHGAVGLGVTVCGVVGRVGVVHGAMVQQSSGAGTSQPGKQNFFARLTRMLREAETVLEALSLFGKRRQVLSHDGPHDIEVYVEIAVNKAVTGSSHKSPGCVGMRSAKGSGTCLRPHG